MGVDVFFCFALLVQNFHQHNLVSLSDLTTYCYKTKVELESVKCVGKLFSTATCDHLIICEWPGGFKNFSAFDEQQY